MDDTMRRNLDIFLRNSEPRAQEQLVQALREVQGEYLLASLWTYKV